MLNFFNRPERRRFQLEAIGDHWQQRPLTHDDVAGTLHVREVPASLAHKRFPCLALAWLDRSIAAVDPDALRRQVQQALEADARCLLVLVHETPHKLAWYAYAASEQALDGAFGSLAHAQLGWGINPDPDWYEYRHARGLVGL